MQTANKKSQVVVEVVWQYILEHKQTVEKKKEAMLYILKLLGNTLINYYDVIFLPFQNLTKCNDLGVRLTSSVGFIEHSLSSTSSKLALILYGFLIADSQSFSNFFPTPSKTLCM